MADQMIGGEEQFGTATVEEEVDRELTQVTPEGFHVHDSATAAWVVRRVVAARDYGARVRLWAESERRRAEAEETRLMYLFGAQLRLWTDAEVKRLRGRRRSVALPSGTVGFRIAPSRVLILDEARVMSWARASCPAALVVTERLVKTPISDHIRQTGEIPTGVEVVDPHDEFFIR